MNYIVENESLRNFEAWAGGKDWLQTAIANDTVDAAEEWLEMMSDGRETPLTDVEINDLLWFDDDLHRIIDPPTLFERVEEEADGEFSKEALKAIVEYLEEECVEPDDADINKAVQEAVEYDSLQEALDEYDDCKNFKELADAVICKQLSNGHIIVF